MKPTPYLRPNLTATRRGIPDPPLLVDVWLDRLLQLREEGDPETPQDAYELLSTRARLLRVRPDLMTSGASEAGSKRAEPTLSARPDDAILRRALDVPNPQAWLDEAARFHGVLEAVDPIRSVEDSPEVEWTLAEWAERLLDDLDDAELVAWTAASLGEPDRELEEGLASCRDWLAAHADDFLVCAVAVQAIGQTLRPDLAGFDLGLAWTADKYVLLLDAQEEAETLAAGEPLSCATAQELFVSPGTRLPDESAEGDWAWLPVLLMAAATLRGAVAYRDWTSPDGQYHAMLAVGPATERVQVMFFRGDDDAVDLAGRSAELAGVSARIEDQASAYFPVEQLRQARAAGLPDRLTVAGVAWVNARERP